jgi:hypothetical protein
MADAYIEHLTRLVDEQHKCLDGSQIADLWAAVPGGLYDDKPFWLIRDDFRKQIERAVVAGELEATIEITEKGFDDGFIEITDKNRIGKIQDGWLGKNLVRFIIHRDKFKQWLTNAKQWPIADDCLLSKWFELEPKVTIRENGYKERNLDAVKWLKDSKPNIESMSQAEIRNALKERNPQLWGSGFEGWNRQQTAWPKMSPGRRPRKQCRE